MKKLIVLFILIVLGASAAHSGGGACAPAEFIAACPTSQLEDGAGLYCNDGSGIPMSVFVTGIDDYPPTRIEWRVDIPDLFVFHTISYDEGQVQEFGGATQGITQSDAPIEVIVWCGESLPNKSYNPFIISQ